MGLRQRLIRDILYPLDLWRSGALDQLRYLREYERTQYESEERLRDLQLGRLRKLLGHAHRSCPFYAERFDRAGVAPGALARIEDLRDFPVLEKRDIQEHRDAMVARDWPRDDLIPYETGGSSGTPLSFYLGHDRKRSRWAATMRHNRWAGWDVGDRVAYLWGAPGDAGHRTLRSRLRNGLLDPHIFLNTGQLTDAIMEDFQRQLMSFRPRVILAYARSAALFARFLKSRGWRSCRPHSVVAAAEVLEPDDRATIEEVFECPVFNRYGCREVSVIASECDRHRGLHVMEEGLVVEVVRGDKPAPPGEDGEILVTDLLNRAMPLIRYRIGDVGAWAEGPCGCGRTLPRLARVTGRATDFLLARDGRMVAGPFLAHSLVAKRPTLGQIQIEQDRIGHLHFRIRRGHQFQEPQDLEFLRDTARKYLGDDVEVAWEFVEEIPATPTGKYLFCRSRVAPAYFRSPERPVAVGGP